jgi:hypothetical protein
MEMMPVYSLDLGAGWIVLMDNQNLEIPRDFWMRYGLADSYSIHVDILCL